jgi:hypothetical protein
MSSSRAGATVALAAGAFVIGLAPLADGDLWWHLAAGRELARTRAFLVVDPFSSGTLGRPWVDVHWLFQLAAYGVHSLGGLTALVLAKCALVAAGALLLAAAVAAGAGPRARAAFVPAFLAALFAVRGLLLLRPVIPTLVLVATFFYLLERFRREGRLTLLAPLPFLQILWANVQALSMLGPALVAAYALAVAVGILFGRRPWFPFADESAPGVDARRVTRGLLGALALCVAACFVTPYGARAVGLSFALLLRLLPVAGNVYSANVAENVPPWVLEQTAPGQFGHIGVYLGLLALCLVASRRLRLSHLVIVVGLAALALASNRNVLLLYWLATPIGVMAFAPTLRRLRVAVPHRRGPLAVRWVGRLAVLCVMTLATAAAARETPLSEPAPWHAPLESARVITARAASGGPGQGSIFTADQFGGYVIWSLGPAFRPYMDTRLVLRSAEEFAEYLAVVDEPARFDAWERDKAFDYVLLPVAYPDRYLPLIAHLYASDRWALVYTDGAETLFARRGLSIGAGANAWDFGSNLGSRAVTDRIMAELSRRFGAAPRLLGAARTQLATLELAVGEERAAERVLDGLETPAAEALRARGRLSTGDLDGAAASAAAALLRDGSDVRSLDVLAVISARRGDSSAALRFLRRALEIDPFDSEAERLLAKWERRYENAH